MKQSFRANNERIVRILNSQNHLNYGRAFKFLSMPMFHQRLVNPNGDKSQLLIWKITVSEKPSISWHCGKSWKLLTHTCLFSRGRGKDVAMFDSQTGNPRWVRKAQRERERKARNQPYLGSGNVQILGRCFLEVELTKQYQGTSFLLASRW